MSRNCGLISIVKMDPCNSFDAKVILKSSGSWLLHTAHSSHCPSHSQQVIFMDALAERQIHDLWGKEGKLKGQVQFFRTRRSIAQMPQRGLCQLDSLSSPAQAQGSPEQFHYLLSSKGRRSLLSYFMIIG